MVNLNILGGGLFGLAILAGIGYTLYEGVYSSDDENNLVSSVEIDKEEREFFNFWKNDRRDFWDDFKSLYGMKHECINKVTSLSLGKGEKGLWIEKEEFTKNEKNLKGRWNYWKNQGVFNRNFEEFKNMLWYEKLAKLALDALGGRSSRNELDPIIRECNARLSEYSKKKVEDAKNKYNLTVNQYGSLEGTNKKAVNSVSKVSRESGLASDDLDEGRRMDNKNVKGKKLILSIGGEEVITN